MNPIIDLSNLPQIEGALTRYLRETHDSQSQISNIKRCSVGFSWMTLAFDLIVPDKDAQALILQIGPPNGLLAPYSARPQVLTLSSLVESLVPVARPYGWSDSTDVFGGPFYISQRIGGTTMQPWGGNESNPNDTDGVLLHFIDTLAALHSFDWRKAPVAEIYDGLSPEHAALRQIDIWSAAIDRWALKRLPMLDWATQWLRDNAPVAPKISIVHGDYRFGNFLRSGDRITAILDWEMVHFGDPHEDLGWACVPINNLASNKLYGVMPRSDVISRYEARASFKVNLSSLHFYEVFALYKQIAILTAGAFQAHAGGNRDVRMAAMGAQAVPTLKLLYRAIDTQP